MLLKDFQKSEEINNFSQESKVLIKEMGNTEIFENRQPTEKSRQFEKDRFDRLSIPENVK